MVSMTIVHISLANPYRQPLSLWDNYAKINIQTGRGELILSPLAAEYIEKLRSIAKSNGFEPGTPIIDLSGNVPGSLYVLDSYTPKNAWILSGQNDRSEYFSYLLSTIPCEEITRAWLLDDDAMDVIPIEPKILLESGLNIGTDYSLEGMAPFPKWFLKERYFVSHHFLFKPALEPDVALAACYKARGIAKPES
jgi:hypothetical protein